MTDISSFNLAISAAERAVADDDIPLRQYVEGLVLGQRLAATAAYPDGITDSVGTEQVDALAMFHPTRSY